MAKNTYNWYNVVVYVFISLAAVGGLAIVCVCGYDIALTLQDTKLEEKLGREIHLIEQVDNDGYSIKGHTYRLPDNEKNSNETDKVTGSVTYKGQSTYKLILLLCLIAAMILGFVQFVGSVGIICNCNSGNLRGKLKAWLLGILLVFLLGILCLAVPLSYNPKRGTHFSIQGFSGYLKAKFGYLIQIRKGAEVHEEIFYITFGTNQVLLLVSMLILTALLPCGTMSYQSVHSNY